MHLVLQAKCVYVAGLSQTSSNFRENSVSHLNFRGTGKALTIFN